MVAQQGWERLCAGFFCPSVCASFERDAWFRGGVVALLYEQCGELCVRREFLRWFPYYLRGGEPGGSSETV